MTDRTLPYACSVANRAVDVLADHGEYALAGEVAVITRATCDLVHALHQEREAITTCSQATAQLRQREAEARLRGAAADASAYDKASQAAIDHLQSLLNERRRHPDAQRRHNGFIVQDEA